MEFEDIVIMRAELIKEMEKLIEDASLELPSQLKRNWSGNILTYGSDVALPPVVDVLAEMIVNRREVVWIVWRFVVVLVERVGFDEVAVAKNQSIKQRHE